MKKNNKYNNDNGIIWFVFFIIFFWCIFYFCCSYTRVFYLRRENYENSKYLYNVHYKCNEDDQIQSNSPQSCCKMKNGKFTCDPMKNCKCKNKNTGYCEKCYPKITKKNYY